MKYKLVVMQNGKQKEWLYDNVTNFVFDEQGNQLLTEYEAYEYAVIQPFTPNNNPYRKTNVRGIEIVLGMRCNFDCKYCSQRAYRNLGYNGSPKDVNSFIEKLKQAGLTNLTDIQFWGGEPLVYWKTLRVLVPKLKELYPHAKMYFPTNGALLTKEIVDFCKKWDIRFSISHDGCNDKNRITDVLENPNTFEVIKYAVDTLKRGQISFGAVLQSGNMNPQKIYDYFTEKFGKEVSVGTHNVVRCHDYADTVTRPFSFIPKKELEEYSENIFQLLNQPNISSFEFSHTKAQNEVIEDLVHKRPLNSVGCECGHPLDNWMAINMNGDIVQCHSHNPHIVRGNLTKLQEVECKGYTHFTQRQLTPCKDCIVVRGCKGGCPSASDEACRLACPNLYARHYGIFKASLAALFGIYLLRVEKMEI